MLLHKRTTLVVLLCAVIAAIIGVNLFNAHADSMPNTIVAKNEDPTIWTSGTDGKGSVLGWSNFGTNPSNAPSDNPNDYAAAFTLQDGSVAYCAIDHNVNGTDAGEWRTYTKTTELASPAIYYCATHGFPATKTIGGYTFERDGDARIVTQIAIWNLTGHVDFSIAADPWGNAAKALEQEAREYETSGGKSYAYVYKYDDNHQTIIVAGTPEKKAKMSIKKTSSNPKVSDGNANYTLAGAEYTVYGSADDANNGTNPLGTLTTGDDGTSNTLDLNMADGSLADGKTAYVKETKAPKGFKKDTSVHTVTLTADQTATLTVADDGNTTTFPLYAKVDLESLKSIPQGDATLAGAEYTLTLNDGTKDIKQWVLKTDDKGNITLDNAHKVSGDDIITDKDGHTLLPLGNYTLHETKAPKGYNLHKVDYKFEVTQNNDDAKMTTHFKYIMDQVKRENLSFQKKANDTQDRMKNVAFLITSKTTGESHVIVTDENGTFSSTANPHTQNTNANDAAITKDKNGNITVDESKLDPTAGIYFKGYAPGTDEYDAVKPNDDIGAFPDDTYEIQELRTSANKGYNLITVSVALHHDNYELNYGTLDDSPIGIHTTAVDSETREHYAQTSESTTIIDTVDYHGLTPGKEYTMTGTAHLVNADGSDGGAIDGATNTITFTPDEADGSVDVPVTFDSSALSGSSVVMFEDLKENGVSVAEHADISDEGQTVHFPSIHTTATDESDGDKEVDVSKAVVIDDEVAYEGLVPGKEYTMTGTLHRRGADGSDAGVLTDKSGNEVTSSVKFVPVASSGTVIVRFSFEADVDDGTVLVAFEDCHEGDVLVASHADISDEGQSVTARKPVTVVEQIAQTGSSLSGVAVFGSVAAVCAVAVLLARRNRR